MLKTYKSLYLESLLRCDESHILKNGISTILCII